MSNPSPNKSRSSKTPIALIQWGIKEWITSLIVILALWVPAIILLLQQNADNAIQLALDPTRENIIAAGTFQFFTQHGLTILYCLLLVILGLSLKNPAFKESQRIYLVFFFTLIFAVVGYSLLKIIIMRPRPFEILDIHPIYQADGYSFPSGHTTTGFAMVLPFIFLLPNKEKLQIIMKIIFLGFAILMGFSRIFVGVHYLSDVLAGAGLAILMLGISVKFTNIVFATKKITIENLEKILKIFLIIGICAIPAFAYFSAT
jgi:membrane-associated phospholipid phosphatase